LAVEECVAPNADFPTYPYLASADFAGGRMTRRSLGCCVLNRISAHWRSRVWLLGTTGLPVGLHSGSLSVSLLSIGRASNQRSLRPALNHKKSRISDIVFSYLSTFLRTREGKKIEGLMLKRGPSIFSLALTPFSWKRFCFLDMSLRARSPAPHSAQGEGRGNPACAEIASLRSQ
jgi:hypothetical protein